MVDIIVIIATSGRKNLLRRTLCSISESRIPENLKKILVIENGKERQSEAVVEFFKETLPVRYIYVEKKGKNNALNKGCLEYPEAFLIFLDDDIRVHTNTFEAYCKAIELLGKNIFLGGRCYAEYQFSPPSWIIPYLPYSAVGWSKGEVLRQLNAPEAMGFNWGAYSSDIRKCGMFNVHRGPGLAHSIGDETEMQESLMENGVSGYYLPEAVVWHYVPEERCSPQWVIERARQRGMARGLKHAERPSIKSVKMATLCLFRIIKFSLIASFLSDDERNFYANRSKNWHFGVLKGMLQRRKISRKFNLRTKSSVSS